MNFGVCFDLLWTMNRYFFMYRILSFHNEQNMYFFLLSSQNDFTTYPAVLKWSHISSIIRIFDEKQIYSKIFKYPLSLRLVPLVFISYSRGMRLKNCCLQLRYSFFSDTKMYGLQYFKDTLIYKDKSFLNIQYSLSEKKTIRFCLYK